MRQCAPVIPRAWSATRKQSTWLHCRRVVEAAAVRIRNDFYIPMRRTDAPFVLCSDRTWPAPENAGSKAGGKLKSMAPRRAPFLHPYRRYSFAISLFSYPSRTCATRILFNDDGESWPMGI